MFAEFCSTGMFMTEHDSISEPITLFSRDCALFFYLYRYNSRLYIFWRFWIFFGVRFEFESGFCKDFMLYWLLSCIWMSLLNFLFFMIFSKSFSICSNYFCLFFYSSLNLRLYFSISSDIYDSHSIWILFLMISIAISPASLANSSSYSFWPY